MFYLIIQETKVSLLLDDMICIISGFIMPNMQLLLLMFFLYCFQISSLHCLIYLWE